MAGFLPEHLPFDHGIPMAHSPRRAAETPHHIDVEPSQPRRHLSKRKSMLGLALRQVTPSKLFHKVSSSESGYSLSRGEDSDGISQQFRCDVLAMSANDFRAAEAECKQLIIEAGGTILEHLQYPGGFLFELSCLVECPLETGDKTAAGGTIVVEPFDAFKPAHITSDNATEMTAHTSEVRNRWKVKANKRLQKKPGLMAPPSLPVSIEPLAEANSIGVRTTSHPRYVGFDDRRLTLIEMLLEDSNRGKGKEVARRHEDAEWETLSEDDGWGRYRV